MPPKSGAVANAWDDDWESLADKQGETEQKSEPAPAKLTKAQRRAQHAEFNRQIWQSADNPEPLLFLEARNTVPVPPTFQPAMKVLARKPPTLLSRNGAPGDDDDDSEEERRKKHEADFEERKARAQKERAEKERRYAEAREKIFGSPAASDESRGASPHKPARGGGKNRGRGGRDSQNRSNEQSPARPQAAGRQLYDPSYSPKPGSVYIQKKDSNNNNSSNSRPGTPGMPNGLEKPIREPRGPQASSRGGRGFAPRGNFNGNVS